LQRRARGRGGAAHHAAPEGYRFTGSRDSCTSPTGIPSFWGARCRSQGRARAAPDRDVLLGGADSRGIRGGFTDSLSFLGGNNGCDAFF